MKYMVAFSSPKRSARTVETAASLAKAMGAELILLRMIPDPGKIGVVAQLIATDRPAQKAQEQVDLIISQLKEQGINATGLVKMGEVSPGIISTAVDLSIDLLFVGTTNIEKKPFFMMEKDPIVHYLVDRCPIPLYLIRGEKVAESD